MSAMMSHGLFGNARLRREMQDMPETRCEDNALDQVIDVRKQRLDRFERECLEARVAWRAARDRLRQTKQRWRIALQQAKAYWQQARAEFLRMTTTSGQFRKAKATYERMKEHAAQVFLECREAVAVCKATREAFFNARRRTFEAKRQQEKLCLMRDEIRRSQLREER